MDSYVIFMMTWNRRLAVFHRSRGNHQSTVAARGIRLPKTVMRRGRAAPRGSRAFLRSSSYLIETPTGLTGAAEVVFEGDSPSRTRRVIAGATSIRIDRVTKSELEGRIYVASAGDDRSLLVGAFEAVVCELGGPPSARGRNSDGL